MSEQELELEKENIIPSKKSPSWCIAVKMHTNKNLYPFIIIHTDGILSINIFHLHNGSYVFFCHNHSHFTKAITDCSVLFGVWQRFAKGTQRGLLILGVLLMLKGGRLTGLEFEREGR